jgi:hypothetical protein
MIVKENELLRIVVSDMLLPILKDGNYNHNLLFSEKLYSNWFRNYLIWRNLSAPLNQFSFEERYLNMYFWLKGFYKLFQKENGFDAGIEQQISLLIEEISNNIPDFDWKKLESLDQEITLEMERSE